MDHESKVCEKFCPFDVEYGNGEEIEWVIKVRSDIIGSGPTREAAWEDASRRLDAGEGAYGWMRERITDLERQLAEAPRPLPSLH